MSESVKLYDLETEKYPHERGDCFRSRQVFECPICGGLTNRVVMGGYPGWGLRAVCPNSSECWHHELEDKIRWLSNPHPQGYRDALEAEIIELRTRDQPLAKNDLVGEPDLSLRRRVTNTRSYQQGSNCTHGW